MHTETIIGASQPVQQYAFDGHTPGVSWDNLRTISNIIIVCRGLLNGC